MSKKFTENRWSILYDYDRHLKNTPQVSGIYCFIVYSRDTKKSEVVYVGKSSNLQVRLKLYHPVEKKIGSFDDILFLKVMITNNQDQKELDYIKRLKPFYNIQHNPKIKRKILYLNGETLY